MIKIIVGVLLLAIFAFLVIGSTVVAYGFKTAMLGWGIAIGLCALLIVGVYLICGGI